MTEFLPGFKLNDEQKLLVRDCYLKDARKKRAEAELKASKHLQNSIARFTDGVEAIINEFLDDLHAESLTLKDKRDQLRALHQLAVDGHDAGLRDRIKNLSQPILDDLELRASRTIPAMFKKGPPPRVRGAATADAPASTVSDDLPSYVNFQSWVKGAPRDELLPGVITITSGYWVPVRGKSRGTKQDPPRFAPVILGTVKGTPISSLDVKTLQGRQPVPDSHIRLIGRLAELWRRATGNMPNVGRSDHLGFGDLVHQIFQWASDDGADVNPKSATHSLREYSKLFRES